MKQIDRLERALDVLEHKLNRLMEHLGLDTMAPIQILNKDGCNPHICVGKFRKIPIEVNAVKYTGKNGHELREWSNGDVIESPVLEPTDDNPTGAYVQIKVIGGTVTAGVGDWIIKGIEGEHYPCRSDLFEKTYEIIN